MSAFHLGHLAQESTDIGSSSTDRVVVVVTVISVLSNPNLIKLVTDALSNFDFTRSIVPAIHV